MALRYIFEQIAASACSHKFSAHPILSPMSDLFAPLDPPPEEAAENAPLADRLRPRALAEVVGQDHITGPEGAIGRMVAAGRLSSMILWGPPGTGKTTHRPPARRCGRPALHLDQRGVLRRRRPEEGVRRSQDRRARRPAHVAVRGRDPPLQPRAAGRLPALRRGRHRHPGRRDHRKPQLRTQRRACSAARRC